MSGSTNFLVFNPTDSANTDSDASYLAGSQRISGLASGIAIKSMHNKLFRQTSVMAAAIAQAMANAGQTVSDTDVAALTTVVTSAFMTRTASGTYSDTSTSIPASSTYAKTIPLVFNAKKGRMVLRGMGVNFGCVVYFDTVNIHSMGIQTSTVSILNKSLDGALTTVHPFGGAYIDLYDIVITGSNLIITFKNSDTLARTLSVTASFWEVEG